MLNERKLTERELDKRSEAIKGLLSNKRALVQKYGKDAEKVMYGIATKQAKKKIEDMNLDNLKELIKKSLQQEMESTPTVPNASTDLTKNIDTGFSGRADYGEEDKALDHEDELELKGLEEGHGLGQKDLDTLKSLRNQIEQGTLDSKKQDEFVKVLDFLIKSNILQDKTKDLSKGKVNEEIKDFEVDDAIMELRNIVDEIDQKADEARDIVRDIFPNELSRLDGYGAFNAMYSANRYDVTLGGFVDRLEEEGYEIEDGVAYVNEDLDVGHQDDEPGMLKAELARAGKMVQMLYRAIDKYDDQGEVDFPQWWQKKIIKANSMLDSAFDYLDGQESVAKIDAMIDTINEEEDEVKKRLAVDKAVKSTLKDEGGAAGIDPLAKAVKKLGVSKDQLKSMIKKIVGVTKHKHGDYISTPINEKELSKSEKKVLKKIEKELRKASKSHKSQSSALAKSTKAHKSQADRIAKLVKEKLSVEEEIEEMKHPQYSTASNRYASRARRPGKFANSPELEKELSDFKSRLKAIQARIAKEKGVEEKKLTAAEKKKKEDIIMALKKQKGGKKNLEPVDYAVATDRAKKLAEKNEK